MPISAVCPDCQSEYSFPDRLAGKKVRCKHCDGIIQVRQAERSGRAERVQKEPRSTKISASYDEAPPRRRRRDKDDRRRSRGKGRRLSTGLIVGGVLALIILVGGGVGLVVWFSGKGGGGANPPDVLVDTSGEWPEPLIPHQMGPIAPESVLTIHVAGADDEYTRDDVSGWVQKLAIAEGGGMTTKSSGGRMTILVYPVHDPKGFADRINFATVRSVDGRVITIVARKVEGAPPPNADAVTKAMHSLKSPSDHERIQALHTLKDTLPDERRSEVARALEPLINAPDFFTRKFAIEALGVWGDKMTVPVLLKAMNEKETRRDVMEALGRLKDERAAEPIAARLEEFFDRHAAVEALQKMGSIAEDAVLKQLKHHDRHVRAAACDILKVIGTEKSLPALQRVAKENDFFLNHHVEEAIKTILARKG